MRIFFSEYSYNINKEHILSKLKGITNSINYKELKDKHCGCPLYNDEKAMEGTKISGLLFKKKL